MNRGPRLVIVMLAGAVLLAGAFFAVHRGTRPALTNRPAAAGPSAAEETGEEHVTRAGPRAIPPRRRVHRPRVARPRTRATTSASQPRASPRPSRPPDVALPLSPKASTQVPQLRAPAQPSEPAAPPADQPALPPPAPVVRAPVLLTAPSAYPAEGYHIVLERGQLAPQVKIAAPEGRVLLRILVRSDGGIALVEIVESSGVEALDHAATRAAWSWRFSPATRDGTPIDAWVLVSVRFVLR